jgi:hypothetical protein
MSKIDMHDTDQVAHQNVPLDPWENLKASVKIKPKYNPDEALSRSMKAKPIQVPVS